MKYNNITEGIFLERPNRFIAKVLINNKEEIVHVKNTGRCKEILVNDAKAFLCKSNNSERKTKYDLVCVEKAVNDRRFLINIDSQVPNTITEEWLKKGNLFSKDAIIKREVTHENSRFDFYIEDKGIKTFLEVKGVTLENDGVVSFPDAPTERGVKHLNELCKCVDEGYNAYVLFVVQMKSPKYFTVSDVNHKEFGNALRNAQKHGVKIIAVDCLVEPDEITIENYVDIKL